MPNMCVLGIQAECSPFPNFASLPLAPTLSFPPVLPAPHHLDDVSPSYQRRRGADHLEIPVFHEPPRRTQVSFSLQS